MRPSKVSSLIAAAICSLSLHSAYADMTILGWPGGPEEKALNALVAKYNATQGKIDKNTVKTLYFPRDGFFDKLSKELGSGTKAFDMNLLATYNVGRYAPFMDPIGADVLAEAKKVYPEAVLKTQQFEGKQFGLPTDLSLHFMYINRDLVGRLQKDEEWKKTYTRIAQQHMGKPLQPKDPQQWDWDDFQATALFFTQSINPASPTQYGTALQLKNLLFNIMVWQSAAYSNGGNWRNGKAVTVNSPGFTKGLEIYKFLVDKGATPPDSGSYEYTQANDAFSSGSVAFMLQWNAAYEDLNNPAKSPKVAGKIDIAPPPKGSKTRGTHVHTLGFGINKASANKSDVNKFLKWMTQAESLQEYIRSGGLTPMKTDYMRAFSRPDIRKMAEFAGWYGFVMDGGTSAQALKIYELQAAEFTAYWAGQKSAADALKATETQMTGLLK